MTAHTVKGRLGDALEPDAKVPGLHTGSPPAATHVQGTGLAIPPRRGPLSQACGPGTHAALVVGCRAGCWPVAPTRRRW